MDIKLRKFITISAITVTLCLKMDVGILFFSLSKKRVKKGLGFISIRESTSTYCSY